MKGGTKPTMERMNDLHGVGSPRTIKRRSCTVLGFARRRRISSFLYLSKLIQNPYRAKSKSITPTLPPHPNSSNHTLHKTITWKTSRKTNIYLKLMSEADNCVYLWNDHASSQCQFNSHPSPLFPTLSCYSFHFKQTTRFLIQ